METPDIKWEELPFGYVPTDYNVRCTFKDGKWGEIEVSDSEYIPVHIAATCLHYGQEIFEGLKAFRGKDGKIRIFRLEENARRIAESARGLLKASRWNRCPKNCSARWSVKLSDSTNGSYPLTEQARPFTFAPSRSACLPA